MNLQKEKSILDLIAHLETRFGDGAFIINDFWEADLCAIGISDPQKTALVYLSTYGKINGQYYISIEDMKNPSISEIKSENADLKELVLIVSSYLNLNQE